MATIHPYYKRNTDPETGGRIQSDEQIGWRLRWKDHRLKARSKIFRGSKKAAEKYLRRLEHDVDEILAGNIKPPEDRIPINDAISEYLDYLKKLSRSPGTIRRYSTSYKAFKQTLTNEVHLSDIRRRDIERFRLNRSETCKSNVVSIDMRHLRAFFNWAVEMEYLTDSPMHGIKIRTVIKVVRFLVKDEIARLYQAIGDDKSVKDLVDFYLNTGLRATEILPRSLTWANVTDTDITITGKGKKVRTIPLNDSLRAILNARRSLDHPFPYTYDVVYGLIRKVFKLAGIKNAGIHTLRKTAGALLIQNGVDIYRVSKFLGHSSVTVTERHYVDLLRDDYQDLSELLEHLIK